MNAIVDWAGEIKARRATPPKFCQWKLTAPELLAARRQMQWDFSGADLSDANLQGVNLAQTSFQYADMGRANLVGADMYGADLTGANLRNANLYRVNLCRTKFKNATLQGANLWGANLDDAVSIVGINNVGKAQRTIYAVEHIAEPMYLTPFTWGTYEQTIKEIEQYFSSPKAAIEKGCYLVAMKEVAEKLDKHREWQRF